MRGVFFAIMFISDSAVVIAESYVPQSPGIVPEGGVPVYPIAAPVVEPTLIITLCPKVACVVVTSPSPPLTLIVGFMKITNIILTLPAPTARVLVQMLSHSTV